MNFPAQSTYHSLETEALFRRAEAAKADAEETHDLLVKSVAKLAKSIEKSRRLHEERARESTRPPERA